MTPRERLPAMAHAGAIRSSLRSSRARPSRRGAARAIRSRPAPRAPPGVERAEELGFSLASRRSHQTAPRENLPLERVTVTLPIHPFYGMTLAVVRMERDRQGRRYVTVEHPRGGNLRLPLDWTDRSAPTSPPTVNGQEVRVSLRGLRALAAAVAVARARKLDLSALAPAPSAQAEDARTSFDRSPGRVVRAVGHRAARPARSVGVPAAQDPAPRPRRRRGGPR
jgi:hypothetical protein